MEPFPKTFAEKIMKSAAASLSEKPPKQALRVSCNFIGRQAKAPSGLPYTSL